MAVSLGIVSVFIAVGCLMGYLIFRQMRVWYIMSKFPGPRAYPLIGNAYQFDTDPRGFFAQISAWVTEYRDLGQSGIGFQLAFYPIIFLMDHGPTVEPSLQRWMDGLKNLRSSLVLSGFSSGAYQSSSHSDQAQWNLMNEWSKLYQQSGTIVVWAGPFAVTATLDCHSVKTILSSSKQLEKGFFYNMLKPWLGTGLLISEGPKWHTRRKLLTPSFHFAILTSFNSIFNEQAQILTTKMLEASKEKSVNIFPMVTRCTLDIICSTAMGKNIGAQEGKNKEYVQAVLDMSDIIQERQKYPWLWIDSIFNQLPSGKKHSHNLQILHSLTKGVILLRRADRKRARDRGEKLNSVIDDESAEVRSRRKLAFLDLLLEVHERDPTFTLEDIREEVDTFMFEGHDTTASGTSWTLYLLGQHPEIQKRVQEELDEVFGGDRDRPATNDDIQKLPYLNCVVKEALRIFPPVPMIARQLQEDTTLSGNFVPKDTVTVIGIYWLHRDPKEFPDPERFDPDRFLPENIKNRHPYAYVPFSAGPRNCIGQKFALTEEKVILSTLLRKLSFRSLQTREEVCPIGELILRPYSGITMEITPRPAPGAK